MLDRIGGRDEGNSADTFALQTGGKPKGCSPRIIEPKRERRGTSGRKPGKGETVPKFRVFKRSEPKKLMLPRPPVYPQKGLLPLFRRLKNAARLGPRLFEIEKNRRELQDEHRIAVIIIE